VGESLDIYIVPYQWEAFFEKRSKLWDTLLSRVGQQSVVVDGVTRWEHVEVAAFESS